LNCLLYQNQAKGNSLVKQFDEKDQIALMIVHGSYIKTIARWVADEVIIDTYRPAFEDVALYDKARSVLKIKASRCYGLIKRTPQEESGKIGESRRCSIDRTKEKAIQCRV